MSFAARVLLLVSTAIMVPVAIQIYTEIGFRKEREAQVSRAALGQARTASMALAGMVDGLEHTLAAVAASPTIRRLDPAGCRAYLSAVAQRSRPRLVITLQNERGLVACRSDASVSAPEQAPDPALFERVKAKQAFSIGDYPADAEPGAKAIVFSYPVFDPAGRFGGAITAPVGSEAFADALSRASSAPQATLLVLDRNGTIVADLPGRQGSGVRAPEPWSRLAREDQPGARELHGPFDSARRMVGVAKVPADAGALVVAAGISDEAALADVDAATRRDAMLIVLGLLLALAAAWLGARHIVQRPMRALARAAEAWRAGDTSARTGLAGDSELERLGQAVDHIAQSHQAHERERQEQEHELRKSRDEAVRANLSKSRFIAAANHDLRQPLHSISMAISLLEMRHKGADEDMVDLARLKRAVQSLQTLLDSLLDISDLEAGLIRPKLADFDLHTVLRPVCDVFEEPARRKAVSFILGECHVAVRSDPNLLGRMLRNLISNAVKFTNPDGKVSLTCAIEKEKVALEIRDTGIGIAEERLSQLFEPFFQSDRREHGHGLGLAIVDRTAKLLEHPVRVQSEPGKGSAFTVEIPRAKEAAAAAGETRGALAGRVLLVEDDNLVAETTAALLRAWGAEVHIATSGNEAMGRIRDGAQAFDVVMVDYRLPDMSGREVIVAARAAWPGARTLLITGDAVNAELQALEAAGTRLLQKPVGAQALLNAVSRQRG